MNSNWTNISPDNFSSPLERDAAQLAGLSIAEFRKLHGNARNMWKTRAFANYKTTKHMTAREMYKIAYHNVRCLNNPQRRNDRKTVISSNLERAKKMIDAAYESYENRFGGYNEAPM